MGKYKYKRCREHKVPVRDRIFSAVVDNKERKEDGQEGLGFEKECAIAAQALWSKVEKLSAEKLKSSLLCAKSLKLRKICRIMVVQCEEIGGAAGKLSEWVGGWVWVG